jgi:hypothetical protein
MANFHEIFQGEHAILPVVHITDMGQAIRNAGIAREEGADGVFLISMEGEGHEYVNDVHEAVRKEFPGFWVGVNYLDLINNPVEVFPNLKSEINGVWLDDAWVNTKGKPQKDAQAVKDAKIKSGWDGLYFGGIAFKYRQRVPDEQLSGLVEEAKKYVDVITTSGDGTGYAPDVSKIELMKDGAGDHPLAIASGISPENVYKYLEISDAYLVASSLLVPYSEDFDPAKVRALVEAVRNK